jgi:hypothetical protein
LLDQERIPGFAGPVGLVAASDVRVSANSKMNARPPTSDDAAVEDSSSGQPLRVSGATACSPDRRCLHLSPA